MKHTKNILKQIFGSPKEGLKYVRKLNKIDKKSPVLFVYTNGNQNAANNFLDWVNKVTNSSQLFSKSEFMSSGGSTDKHVILVGSIADVTDDLINMVVKVKNTDNKKLIIASANRPTLLDYVNDPNLLIANISGFDQTLVENEMTKFMKKLNKE